MEFHRMDAEDSFDNTTSFIQDFVFPDTKKTENMENSKINGLRKINSE